MSTTYILNEKLKESKTNKERFKQNLVEILKEENITTANVLAPNFLEIVLRKIRYLSQKDSFVADLIKGNAHMQIDIDKFFTDNHVNLSKEQKRKIHDLIQLLLMNEMNEYRIFQYVTQTFPLFSFLKRELLETRQDEGIRQWEFIAKYRNIDFNIYFSNIANYKEISDDMCAQAVSTLVKHMTNNTRFDNTISQPGTGRGWFPNGTFELPSQMHTIKQHTLFLIGYSFKLSLAKYDEMIDKNEDIYDCFNYEDNMFRFALMYIRNQCEIEKFIDILEKNKDNFRLSESYQRNMDKPESVTQKINNFFVTHSGSMGSLSADFIGLLQECGVILAKEREISLQSQRKLIAQKYMCKLLSAVNIEPITSYYSLLNGTAKDIIRFKYQTDQRSADKAIAVLHKNYESLMKCKPSEKSTILSTLCDNISADPAKTIMPSVRPILNTKFTPNRITKISKGTWEQPITRYDILKMCYLQTFVNFVNQNNQHFRNKHEMTEGARTLTAEFETMANQILRQCCFAPVHATFPLDGLICTALSSAIQDKCIPEIFQACLPLKLES